MLTYHDNGDITIRELNSLQLITEFMNQIKMRRYYVTGSYQRPSPVFMYHRLTVSTVPLQSSVKPTVDITELSDSRVKVFSRDCESFLTELSDRLMRGDCVIAKDVYMSLGNYSFIASTVCHKETSDEPLKVHVDEMKFDINTALAITEKSTLSDYCKQFDVTIDRRKSLEDIQKILKESYSE